MKLSYSRHFLRCYGKAPRPIQRIFDKQAVLLLQNIRHPSLHAKKYDEAKGIWQARVNEAWRFYFTIEGDVYHLHEIKAHPK
jgi:plasmid maintenance system killer protein